jgi:hypothetical protein
VYKLKSLLMWLLTKYAHSFFSSKTVYVFSGVRRSGNHACISWLNNALAGEDDELIRVTHKVYWSKKSEVLHLNEINFLNPWDYILLLRQNKQRINQAKIIFLSLEDYCPNGAADLYAARGARFVYITRRVLSTVSSRITYNVKRAQEGVDRGDVHVGQTLFSIIKETKSRQPLWVFENWNNDPNWRKSFLEYLGLSSDISPKMTEHGGGSSFHGLNKNLSQTLTDYDRWSSIKWPERVKELVLQNKELLTQEEIKFLDKW